jgi:hypothetical protein
MKRRPAGLTLAEGIVALGLTVVMGVLIWQFISYSLGAHRKGQLSRTAQAGTRDLISLLVGELRSASVPPLTSPGVSSPVFWPGAWGPEEEASALGEFYPREEVVLEGQEYDQATNRLLLVRTVENPDESDLDPLARYALVELLVPEQNPGRIERRVHNLKGLALLHRVSAQGADDAAHDTWALNSAALAGMESPSTPDIVYDAGSDSRVAFRISHVRWRPPSDPGRTRNPEPFDPGVFRIEVAVAYDPELSSAVNLPWPIQEQWNTVRSEVTELRIPSVRSK